MEEDGVHTLAGVTSYGLAWINKVDLKQTNSFDTTAYFPFL